jgi:hypothetical protein
MFWDEAHARTARTFRSQVIGLEKRFMPESLFPMSVLIEFIRELTDENQVIWKS